MYSISWSSFVLGAMSVLILFVLLSVWALFDAYYLYNTNNRYRLAYDNFIVFHVKPWTSYSVSGEWFFRTASGDEMGPYPTKDAAEFDMALYISTTAS